MDTKRLFIKTQTNLINFAVAVGFIFFALSVYTFSKTPLSHTTLIPIFFNLVTLIALLATRIKKKPKFAMIALLSFATLSLYSLVVLLIGLPKTIVLYKTLAPQSGYFPLIFSISLGYGCFLLGAFLYYRVYKAVLLINQIQKESE